MRGLRLMQTSSREASQLLLPSGERRACPCSAVWVASSDPLASGGHTLLLQQRSSTCYPFWQLACEGWLHRGALRPIAATQLAAAALRHPNGCPGRNVGAGLTGTWRAAAAGRRCAPELAPAGRRPAVCHAAEPRLSRHAAPLFICTATLCSCRVLACSSGAASAQVFRRHVRQKVLCTALPAPLLSTQPALGAATLTLGVDKR